MNTKKLDEAIKLFKKLNASPDRFEPVVRHERNPYLATAADLYDIRLIGKQEAKKLSTRDLQGLIEYGNGYIAEYQTGKFMTKKDRFGLNMADFDEAEAYYDIVRNVAMLNAVLKGI